MNQRDFDLLAREAESPRQRLNRERRERRQIALFRKQLDSLVYEFGSRLSAWPRSDGQENAQ
jgi:hypothetical protein